MPYIYSVSWQVTHNGGSMLRPLVMDFASDRNALTIADQYLFGPALMVNPVTQPGAISRSVYLPGKDRLVRLLDRQTRSRQAVRVDAAAPIESMPIYVPAGSILPLGPDVEYVDQKPADPLEVRVYPGADGSFILIRRRRRFLRLRARRLHDHSHSTGTTLRKRLPSESAPAPMKV
jgi:alpha-D-xyloside xylohydrolase